MKISKSKRNLAKEILKEDGWGKGFFAAQEQSGVIYFYENKPIYQNYTWNGVATATPSISSKKLPNWHQTCLNRAEFDQIVAESAEQGKPDAEGWIEWKGGECPVGDNDLVVCKMRDGSAWRFGEPVKAWTMGWRHDGDDTDIIAYRLYKPEQVEPQHCESVTLAIPEPATAPTLDQLLRDYRNTADFAAAKQAEADEAAKMRDERWKAAQARACELGVHISVELVVDAEMSESEPVITDWRDLRVGDVIAFTGSDVELEPGGYEVCDTQGVGYAGKHSIQVSVDGLRGKWISNDSWRFIRRP